MKNKEIISVVIISYNTDIYIEDCLNSIKQQEYQNIELIVSDDASTDNTVEIIDRWLTANKDRFISYKIITSKHNTGITPNLNRGLKHAKGDYIKVLAGDDILLNNCLTDSYNFCIKFNYEIILGEVTTFSDKRELNSFPIFLEEYNKQFLEYDKEKKYISLLKGFSLFTGSLFFSKELIYKIGFFNEEFPMMEDYPFYLKVLEEGYDIGYLKVPTMKYRIRTENNAFFKKSKRFIVHRDNLINFENNYIIPRIIKLRRYFILYNIYVNKIARILVNSEYKLIRLAGKIFQYLSFEAINTKRKYFLWKLKYKAKT